MHRRRKEERKEEEEEVSELSTVCFKNPGTPVMGRRIARSRTKVGRVG